MQATLDFPTDALTRALAIGLPMPRAMKAAAALRAQFPGFAEAVAAPIDTVTGIAGERAAAILSAVREAATALVREREIGNRCLLTNWRGLVDYLRAASSRERAEGLRILYLDNKNRLIADETAGQGSVTHCPVYPREIVRRAIMLDACGVILSHNHPSGDPTPSREDIAMTQQAKAALGSVGVTLHDHVVVGADRCASFRQMGLL